MASSQSEWKQIGSRVIFWKTFQSRHQSEDVKECALLLSTVTPAWPFSATVPDRGHSATYACTRVAQHECTRSMPSARSHVQSSKRPISNMPHSSSRSSRWHWMSKKLTRTCLRSAARFDMRPLKASLRLSCGGDTFPSLALLRDLTFCRHITWCKKMRVALLSTSLLESCVWCERGWGPSIAYGHCQWLLAQVPMSLLRASTLSCHKRVGTGPRQTRLLHLGSEGLGY